MPFTRKSQLTLEKSPYYFAAKLAPSRIFKVNPKMKFIIMIRNPVDRCVSHFTHDLMKIILRNFKNKKFSNAEKYFTELVLHPNGTIKNRPAHYIVTHGLYVLHYKNWLQYFPRAQFLFINGENFIKNPYEEIKKAEIFLDLKPFIQKKHFIFDAKKGFFCKNKNLRSGKIECMGKDKGRKHPNISENILRKLKEFYKPYNIQLFDMLKSDPFWEI